MGKGHEYTTGQIAWLKTRAGLSRKAMAYAFNQTFGTSLSESAIKGTCQRHGIYTGRTGRFEKGHAYIPGSGAKAENATSFKKGMKPHNHNPIGHVRLTKDGYMECKLTDTRCTRHDYHAVHRLVWEHYHGPIPKSHIVIFRDGDRFNFRIENLELVSRAVHAARCKLDYYSYPQEVRPELDALIELKRAMRRRTKKEKQ